MQRRSVVLSGLVALSMFLAVPSQAAPAVGVDAANNLIRFDTNSPTQITSTTLITGLTGGDTIVGVDTRPATGALFALASSGRLYSINLTTGAATLVATLSVALSGTQFGVDFNPTVDRLRITSDADQNLRIVPDTGVATVDTPLAYATTDVNAAQNANVTAAAYTNSAAGATTTTLFGIDTNLDILVTQNPPNAGTLNTVGPLGVNATAVSSFDIDPAGNIGVAALQVGGGTAIYTINLTTGAATLRGNVGAGSTTLVGFAIVPTVAGAAAVPALSPLVMILLLAALGLWGAMAVAKVN